MFFTYEIRKVINRSIGGDAKTQQSRTAGKKIYECNGANKITLPLIISCRTSRFSSFVLPKCFIFVNSVKHKISLIIWLLPLSTVKQASLWAFFNRVKKIPLDFRQRNIRHSRHLSKARAQREEGEWFEGYQCFLGFRGWFLRRRSTEINDVAVGCQLVLGSQRG